MPVMKSSVDEPPIVLTATIIPNIANPSPVNIAERLAEYRRVLQFCLPFAPVIFLENSQYPLEQHPEFTPTSRLQIHRFKPSNNPERGKGYQEFEMLDAWLVSTPQPPNRWLKITGRYQVLNLTNILFECRLRYNYPLLIDRLIHLHQARTYLFCVNTTFYMDYILGIFKQCDDRKGNYIEHILYHTLKKNAANSTCTFKTQPRLCARAGSTGKLFPTGKFQWMIKQGLRNLNNRIDNRYLWYIR
jgi:hypothetical protein